MACEIIGIDTSALDCANDGGITKAYMCKLSDITAITVTSNVISGFTMASTGLWIEFVPDANQTAYFNEEGSITNDRHSNETTGFMQFQGVTNTYITNANKLKDCCDLVIIWVMTNGTRRVQGIEYDTTAVGNIARSKNRRTRAAIRILSDTAANGSRMEYTITGNNKDFSMPTSLTDSAIEAL